MHPIGQCLAEARGAHSGRPQHRARFDHLLGAVGHFQSRPLRVDVGHQRAGEHFHAQLFQRAFRSGGQIGRITGQHLRGTFGQHDAGAAGVDVAKFVLQRVLGQFADGARQLHPGRAAAHHHEGHQPRLLGGVLAELRRLEGAEDALTHLQGVLHRLQPGCILAPRIVAEIAVLDAGGSKQDVIADFRAAVEDDLARHRIQIHCGALHHAHIGAAAQHMADGRGDVAGRQLASGDLVEQWLEQVIVALVDHGDPKGRVL